MPLPSLLKRKPKPAPATGADIAGDDGAAVLQARQRARRRLIGATVLLAAGIVAFPLVFETQPRPLPSDIPIAARRDIATANAPATPPARPLSPAVAEVPADAASARAASVAAAPSSPSAPATTTTAKHEAKADPKSDAKSDPKAARQADARPSDAKAARVAEAKASDAKTTAATDEARQASAVASASAASEPRAARYVVQVGAYTDPNTLRDVRAKVERLGLKTYTQTIDTEAGRRTRVRVGPYETRQEAEGASAKLKLAGLPGNVLAP